MAHDRRPRRSHRRERGDPADVGAPPRLPVPRAARERAPALRRIRCRARPPGDARAGGRSLAGGRDQPRPWSPRPTPSPRSSPACAGAGPSSRRSSLRKPLLLALSRAIEDESCARAERALLFGSFQRERFYRQSEHRWRELARTAELAVVFADFARPRRPARGPIELPIDSAAPLTANGRSSARRRAISSQPPSWSSRWRRTAGQPPGKQVSRMAARCRLTTKGFTLE